MKSRRCPKRYVKMLDSSAVRWSVRRLEWKYSKTGICYTAKLSINCKRRDILRCIRTQKTAHRPYIKQFKEDILGKEKNENREPGRMTLGIETLVAEYDPQEVKEIRNVLWNTFMDGGAEDSSLNTKI
jgi:hypothetical protein